MANEIILIGDSIIKFTQLVEITIAFNRSVLIAILSSTEQLMMTNADHSLLINMSLKSPLISTQISDNSLVFVSCQLLKNALSVSYNETPDRLQLIFKDNSLAVTIAYQNSNLIRCSKISYLNTDYSSLLDPAELIRKLKEKENHADSIIEFKPDKLVSILSSVQCHSADSLHINIGSVKDGPLEFYSICNGTKYNIRIPTCDVITYDVKIPFISYKVFAFDLRRYIGIFKRFGYQSVSFAFSGFCLNILALPPSRDPMTEEVIPSYTNDEPWISIQLGLIKSKYELPVSQSIYTSSQTFTGEVNKIEEDNLMDGIEDLLGLNEVDIGMLDPIKTVSTENCSGMDVFDDICSINNDENMPTLILKPNMHDNIPETIELPVHLEKPYSEDRISKLGKPDYYGLIEDIDVLEVIDPDKFFGSPPARGPLGYIPTIEHADAIHRLSITDESENDLSPRLGGGVINILRDNIPIAFDGTSVSEISTTSGNESEQSRNERNILRRMSILMENEIYIPFEKG